MTMNQDVWKCVCSFCGRRQGACEEFYTNYTAQILTEQIFNFARICPECAGKAYIETYSLRKDPALSTPPDRGEVYTPEKIEAYLSQVVIGQDSAKRCLAIAAWQHIHRSIVSEDVRKHLPKSNLLIVGPTGTGKTLLLETLAKFLDVPLLTFDTSTVTKAGYVGANAEECVHRLITTAGGSLEKAAFGIIHLDEVDKIRKISGLSNDVGGEAAQQSFLKILEGTTLYVDQLNTQTNKTEKVPFSTKDILFVATGAFPDLYEKHTLRERSGGIGFIADYSKGPDASSVRITSEHMAECGLIPEFLRRLPSVAILHSLSEKDLSLIIRTSTCSPIQQYAQLFASMGVKTVWQDDFIEEVARRAYAQHIGASGITRVLEFSFRDLLFTLPSMVHCATQPPVVTFTAEFLDTGVPYFSCKALTMISGE